MVQDHHPAPRSPKHLTVPCSAVHFDFIQGHLLESMCPLPPLSNLEPSQLQGPGDSQFYPLIEHPFESACIDVFSITPLIVKEHSTQGSTSTPFNTAVMCVEQHSGYIVAAPDTKEDLTGQGAPKLIYCKWSTGCLPN